MTGKIIIPNNHLWREAVHNLVIDGTLTVEQANQINKKLNNDSVPTREY